MESELERFNKQNTQLELSIKELTQKLKATDKEMHQERQKVKVNEHEEIHTARVLLLLSINFMVFIVSLND